MKHSLLYPLLILAISPFAEGATTRTWTGFGTTGNWNTATNWTGDTLPGSGDDAVIDISGSVYTINHTANTHTVNSLTSQENISFSGGTLNMTNASTINGTLTLSGGTLNVPSTL